MTMIRVHDKNGPAFEADLAWAKRSCKRCYGTGIQGVLTAGQGMKKGERRTLLCACVEKEARARARAGLMKGGVAR